MRYTIRILSMIFFCAITHWYTALSLTWSSREKYRPSYLHIPVSLGMKLWYLATNNTWVRLSIHLPTNSNTTSHDIEYGIKCLLILSSLKLKSAVRTFLIGYVYIWQTDLPQQVQSDFFWPCCPPRSLCERSGRTIFVRYETYKFFANLISQRWTNYGHRKRM